MWSVLGLVMTNFEFRALFDALRSRGVTQEKLAALLETTQETVSNWYRGRRISRRFASRLRVLQAATQDDGYAAKLSDAAEDCRAIIARLTVIAEQTGEDTLAAQQQVRIILAAVQAGAAWLQTRDMGFAFSGDHAFSV